MNNEEMNFAKILNYRKHAQHLNIPILKGFNIEQNKDPKTIFVASSNGFVEQMVSDGFVEKSMFSNRIDTVIASTINQLKKSGIENADESFIFYKNYDNNVFNFKLYFCDLIINTKNGKKVIRQLIAYFVEPNFSDFYQITLNTPAFNFPTDELKVGKIDLENDKISALLDKMMVNILNNLNYKK